MSSTVARRWLRTTRAVVQKDLRIEARRRVAFATWVGFAAAIIVAVRMTIGAVDIASGRLAPSGVWLAFALVGAYATSRAQRNEYALGGFSGVLTTSSPLGAIFLGKLLSNVVLTLLAVLSASIGYSLVVMSPADVPVLVATAVLGAIGIGAAGTIVAMSQSHKRRSNLLIALLGLPIAGPVIVLAAEATRQALNNSLATGWSSVLSLLASYNLLVIVGATARFASTPARV